MTRVIVLGGGIAGLAAAHRLAERGAEVVLLEASEQLGGLGGTFAFEGRRYEKFYHTASSADAHLQALVRDAGMGDVFDWHKTTMGMVVDGTHYDFTTPLDLLKFDVLSLPQRLRLGAGAKALRFLGRGKDLDGMSAEEWMRPIFGDRAWEKVWRPMFTMKFGGASVPALYLYERLARESNVALRSYPDGGYGGLADGIAASIERLGGRIMTSTPVRSIDVEDGKVIVGTDEGEMDAPWAISTLPMPQLEQIATGRLDQELHLPKLDYMGVINLLVLTNRPLSGHYWAPIIDSGTDFAGIIELSTLTGTEMFQGRHASYLMHYTDRRSAAFAEPDEVVEKRWLDQFRRLYRLSAGDIDRAFVFRTPFVEPVWQVGYGRVKPPPRIGTTPLFMATTAQAYPRVTSWDSATETAERTVAALEQVA